MVPSIAFASHSLAQAETKYVKLDKEGLALAFGVKMFLHYAIATLELCSSSYIWS